MTQKAKPGQSRRRGKNPDRGAVVVTKALREARQPTPKVVLLESEVAHRPEQGGTPSLYGSFGGGGGGAIPDAPYDLDREIDRAIAATHAALRSLFSSRSGSWKAGCDAGPMTTGMVAVVLNFVGELDAQTAAGVTKYLLDNQLGDGGFPSYPTSTQGDLSTTAICLAALIATGAIGNTVNGARAFINRNGGQAKLTELARAGDLGALMLAMADPAEFPIRQLPSASLLFEAAPGAELALERRFAYLIPFRMLVADVIVAYLHRRAKGGEKDAPLPNLARLRTDFVDGAGAAMSRSASAAKNMFADAKSAGSRLGIRALKTLGRAVDSVPKRGGGVFRDRVIGVLDGSRDLVPKGGGRAVQESFVGALGGTQDALSAAGRVVPNVDGAGTRALDRLMGIRCGVYLKRFHNEDGSWLYGDAVHTALALAALKCLGSADKDPAFAQGLRWLRDQRVNDAGGGVRYDIFRTDIWPTSFAIRALIESGASPTSPMVARAVDWLAAAQRDGTWAFQEANTTTPDVDDAAVAMAALVTTRDALREVAKGNADSGSKSQLEVCDVAIDAAQDWLFSRQNSDGGWASYQHDLPSKPSGRFMASAPPAPATTTFEQVKYLMDPPPEIGDPATEDVTGRVLFALGRNGVTANQSPAVRQAVEFLEQQHDERHGGWWGRWVVNYVAATSWVLRGLSAVGARYTPAFDKGIAFLLDHQNRDGGWAETVASYSDPSMIGGGSDREQTSNPGLSGLVLCALMEAGHKDTDAVRRGVRCLVDHFKQAGGRWNATPAENLHALFPPGLFYTLPQTELQLPLEALGGYRGARRSVVARTALVGAAPGVEEIPGLDPPSEDWTKIGDREADELVEKVFRRPDAREVLHQLFDALVLNQDIADPAKFPTVDPVLLKFFNNTALPQHDPAKLERAHELFVRCGFGVPLVLFCSSLPQCYAVPDGARILAATKGISTNARRRIVETAQLVFDVGELGGLTQQTGRGLRTSQKVRMLHAVIRTMLMRSGQAPGTVPLNQMQLVGTLMSFSVIVIDGLRTLGFEVTSEDAEAWYHLWRVVGLLLGIEDRFLPKTVDAADEVCDYGRSRF